MGSQQEGQAAVLESLASGIEKEAGFSSVVVNLFRPDEDDYEILVLRGPDELRDAIGGEKLTRDSWMQLLEGRFERFGAYFIPEGEGEWGDAPMYDPPEDAGEGENRWRKGDALFAPMRRTNGSILGIVSVDMPRDGQRPTSRQILTLTSLCSQAGAALVRDLEDPGPGLVALGAQPFEGRGVVLAVLGGEHKRSVVANRCVLHRARWIGRDAERRLGFEPEPDADVAKALHVRFDLVTIRSPRRGARRTRPRLLRQPQARAPFAARLEQRRCRRP